MAWLQASHASSCKDAHEEGKGELSAAEGHSARLEGRASFLSLAESAAAHPQAAVIKEVIRMELDLRGGDTSEPAWLRCAPSATQRALRAP